MTDRGVTQLAQQAVVELRGEIAADLAGYARQKVAGVLRHTGRAVLHMHIQVERHRDPARERPVTARATVDLDGTPVSVHAAATTPRDAVDQLVERLDHRLERVSRGRHRRRGRPDTRDGAERRTDAHGPHRPAAERDVVRHTTTSPLRSSIDDAVAEMDDQDLDFHLFVEESSGQDAVVYRDGPDALRLAQIGGGSGAIGPHTVALNACSASDRSRRLCVDSGVAHRSWDRCSAGVRRDRRSTDRPGPHRRFAGVQIDLDEVRDAAHRHDATVNDVVLTAVAAALHRLSAIRGEHVDDMVISVPFSARRHTTARDLGNRSGVIPLRVPGAGDPARRLTSVAAMTRAARSTRPGASTALLSPFFRLLAAVGLYRWFIDRQRLIHTFVSNLRGPDARRSFLGYPITTIVPLSAPTGNVTVSFAVLSYAGSLRITLAADPDTCPDLSELRELLDEELRVLTATRRPLEAP